MLVKNREAGLLEVLNVCHFLTVVLALLCVDVGTYVWWLVLMCGCCNIGTVILVRFQWLKL
jgi:hypothetical protein